MKDRKYPRRATIEQGAACGSGIDILKGDGTADSGEAGNSEDSGLLEALDLRGERGKLFGEILHPKKRLFLEIFSANGHASMACRAIGIDRSTEWIWRKRDPQFAALREIAYVLAVESLECEAYRRAVFGVEVPVFQGGKVCGSTRRYSDALLIMLLKAAKPEVYRDRWSGTIRTISEPSASRGISLANLSEAQLGQLEAISAAVAGEAGDGEAELSRLINFADDLAGP